MAITGTPAALASARTSPNRSGNGVQVQQRSSAREQFILARHVHWPDVADLAIADEVPPAPGNMPRS